MAADKRRLSSDRSVPFRGEIDLVPAWMSAAIVFFKAFQFVNVYCCELYVVSDRPVS